MEDSIETFNAWDRYIGLLSQFQWRSQISFNLHRPLGFKVEPHSAVIFLWLYHFLKGCFPEVGGENALLRFGQYKQLI
jgi:hypothetical protein